MIPLLTTLALGSTISVPGDYDTLAEALPNVEPFGTTIQLGAGPFLLPAALPVHNVVIQFVGEGPTTTLTTDGSVSVFASSLTFQSLTLRGGDYAFDSSDLTLTDVGIDSDPFTIVGGRVVARSVRHGGSAALGAPVLLPSSIDVADSRTTGAWDLFAPACTLARVHTSCALGPSTLACDGSLIDSLFIGSGAVAMSSSGAGPLEVHTTTFRDTPLRVDGTMIIEDSLFVGAPSAVRHEAGAAITYGGNLWFDTAPSDLVGVQSDPGFGPAGCELDDAVPSTPVPAGFTASTTPDGDGDGSPFWFDCNDTDVSISPDAPELPGDGVDQDCDGVELCYLDGDGDGVGDATTPGTTCTDPGQSSLGGDCDDSNPEVYPGAEELCDGLDNDCGGQADDGQATVLHCFDGDGDGYGDDAIVRALCAPGAGYVVACGDCDDLDPSVNPGAPDVPSNGIDEDCDGTELVFVDGEDDDGDGYCDGVVSCADPANLPGDCDDTDDTVHPGQSDAAYCDGRDHDCDGVPYTGFDVDQDGVPACGACLVEPDVCDCNDFVASANPFNTADPCDGIDNDCDGAVDEDSLFDADGDGFGTDAAGDACPGGLIDCDDTDPSIFPGAVEDLGDTGFAGGDCVDRDCDGRCSEDPLLQDADGDGFCPAGIDDGTGFCTLADDYEPDPTSPDYRVYDCDDANPLAFLRDDHLEVFPDGVDNDCDGAIDEDVPNGDFDGDGFTEADGDCNDLDPSVNPGTVDAVCNGVDDDCDGLLEDFERDADNDGWLACPQLRLGQPLPIDCDDNNPLVHPHRAEICGDGIDNDCLGTAADEDTDFDGDGWSSCSGDCNDDDASVFPGAPEVCNLRDDDCDGTTDEGFDRDADGGVPAGACDLLIQFGAPVDCDDDNARRREGLSEACDGLDNDCDEEVDEGTNVDSDGDGLTACEGDCNDEDATIHPFARERCNSIDVDCDGGPFSEGGLEAFDADRDGIRTCQGDCDDTDDTVHRLMDDRCGVDANCNGIADDHAADGDGDGFNSCEDCLDSDADIRPDAMDLCGNGIDEDCDGLDAVCDLPTGTTGATADTGGSVPTTDTAPPLEPTGETGVPAGNTGDDLPRGWFCSSTRAPTSGLLYLPLLALVGRRRQSQGR